jgi:Tfp pilus assembly protein PilO
MSRNYLEAFVIILIAAGLGFFLVLPKYSELQEVKVSVAAIELAQYEANLEKIETAFPETIDAPALMNFVQAAAMQSGLIVKSVTYSGTTVKKVIEKEKKVVAATDAVKPLLLQSYGVDAEFIGSYLNFKDFLARIEYSSRLVSANQISVSAESIEGNKESSKSSLVKVVSEEEAKELSADPILNFKVVLSANYYQ